MKRSKIGTSIPTSLGPALVKEETNTFGIDLSRLQIFLGLSILSRTLGDDIVERVVSSPGDISILYRINPNINYELCEKKIGYIQIHSRAGVLGDVNLFREEFQDHLRIVFGTFQRQVWAKKIHPEFFGEDLATNPSRALVFPFHHVSPNEKVDYQFILERVANQREPGEFLLRLTIETFDRANIDLKSIDHEIVSDLDSRVYIAGSTKIAESIHGAVVGACQRGENLYSEENRRFNRVFEQIQKTALGALSQINFIWDESFAGYTLTVEPRRSLPVFKKLFLILEDQEVTRLLKEGYTVRADLGETVVYVDLSRLDRVLNYSFQQRRRALSLGHYLARMPRLEAVADRRSHAFSLQGLRVFLVHHITSEILGLIEALRRLDAKSTHICFVKYGGLIPSEYLDILLDLPVDAFYMSGLELKVSPERKTYYSVSPLFSDVTGLEAVKQKMDREEPGFFDAMKLLATHLFLKLCLEAAADGDRVLLIEDGGYLAPFLNQHALNGDSLGEVCARYLISGVARPERAFRDFLTEVLIGSVEHTRNGYDRVKKVRQEGQGLLLPVYSIAISREKTLEESREVAFSILKAIEDILHGQGKILSRRKFLLLGSEGNIGSFLRDDLRTRLHPDNPHLLRVDVRNEPGADRAYRNLTDIPADLLYATDFILGVIGESIITEELWENLLLHGAARDLFIASGSTKTAEFTHLIEWLNPFLLGRRSRAGDCDVRAESARIIDPQTKMDLGGIVRFRCTGAGGEFVKNFYLLSDLSPVNFLYYGAPTEIMDGIIAQLLCVSLGMADQFFKRSLPSPGLYAVDHEIDEWGNRLSDHPA